jgi:predicted phosphoserine aminotransferase
MLSGLILMIPGPVYVRPEILKVMSSAPWGHRDNEETTKRLKPIRDNLKKLLYLENTDYEIIISTSSGTGLMEASIMNCVKDDEKVLCVSIGAFGDLWHSIVESCGKKAKKVTFASGKSAEPEVIEKCMKDEKYSAVTITHNETSTGVMNPVKEVAKVVRKYGALVMVDAVSSMAGIPISVKDWNIDVIVSSSQKCFGLPPGLAIGAVSGEAMKKAESVNGKGTYFNFLDFRDSNLKEQTPCTPNEALIDALNFQLNYIFNEEGLENRFIRHSKLAQKVRDWICKNHKEFKLFPSLEIASDTVTCIQHPLELDKKLLKNELRKRGYLFDTGYRKLEKDGYYTFRIPTMGDLTEKMLDEYLYHIDDIIKKK